MNITHKLIFTIALTLAAAPSLTGTAGAQPVESLRRAIAITDATMKTSFTGNDMRMYDTYNTATHQGSGVADVWPYTAALEAHCSVLEALEALKEKAPDLNLTHGAKQRITTFMIRWMPHTFVHGRYFYDTVIEDIILPLFRHKVKSKIKNRKHGATN